VLIAKSKKRNLMTVHYCRGMETTSPPSAKIRRITLNNEETKQSVVPGKKPYHHPKLTAAGAVKEQTKFLSGPLPKDANWDSSVASS
jgi:hypothetical protein